MNSMDELFRKDVMDQDIMEVLNDSDKEDEQEWSSLESSSYENWDEIEMLFGHLVIGNLQLVIGNRQLAINNWLLAEGNRKKTIGNWTDQSVCFVSDQNIQTD